MYLGAIPLVDMPIYIARLSKHGQIALRGNSTPHPALKNVQARINGLKKLRSSARNPAGYALRTGKPVISNHLEIEERFRTPTILVRHGIRRAMNVILQGDGSPYGVLEV